LKGHRRVHPSGGNARALGVVAILCSGALAACDFLLKAPASERNATSAIGHTRVLVSMLAEYERRCGGYPETLKQLSTTAGAGNSSACLAEAYQGPPAVLDGGILDDYQWSYLPRDPRPSQGRTLFAHYELRATSRGTPDARSFWVSDEAALRFRKGPGAGPSDSPWQVDSGR
jgi:hypothetical protein